MAHAILEKLPMDVKIIEGPVGKASSIKMVRSIMVKGLEALTAECALAAVEADVLDEVFFFIIRISPLFLILSSILFTILREAFLMASVEQKSSKRYQKCLKI